MKVKLLTPLVGSDRDHTTGDIIDVTDKQAHALVSQGMATAENKTAYNKILKQLKDEEKERIEKEKKAAAILYKDELESEKNTLLQRVNRINEDLEIEDITISKNEYISLNEQIEDLKKEIEALKNPKEEDK